MGIKLGKLAPKPNYKSVPFAMFMKPSPYPIPVKAYWEYKLDQNNLKMFKNDEVGNCTVAGPGHALMNMTAHTGKMVTPTDEQILEVYSAVTGYDSSKTDENGNNPTDNGAAITDVLDYWQEHGIAGHKILGWIKFNETFEKQFNQVIYLFSCVIAGVNLPNSAITQFENGETWKVLENDGGSAGGHCVPFFGYGREGRSCITWAKNQPATHPWLQSYLDEAYGIISEDWFDRTDKAPNGFDKDGLWNYLKTLKA